MEEKQLKRIKFNANAFQKDSERTNLQGNERFTADVQRWNSFVDPLDRYDSFAELLIDASLYCEREFETEDGESICYGIPRQSFHETDDEVIFKHQKESAGQFLKKLRGFGLLADVVGSGKTFEAGIVLSELAVRGLISSMLLIVPEQVYGSWIYTIEKCFGLGKWNGEKVVQNPKEPVTLKPIGNKLDPRHFLHGENGDFDHPKYPMIVKMEDFVQWDVSSVKNKLFDVVVVDEAHHLNVDKGKDAKAMEILSELMKTKKAANMTYCLLLSATPHAGNLADMFRLWYFIRCKGGEPADFREGVSHSVAFEEEREFYLKNICRGATTIMDFVRKEKIALIRGGDAIFCKAFRDYFEKTYPDDDFESLDAKRKNEVLDVFLGEYLQGRKNTDPGTVKNYILKFYSESYNSTVAPFRKKFEEYLAERGCAQDFDYYYEGLKDKYINDFFDGEPEIQEKIKEMIAEAYHHGVLRSIMIRQPQACVAKPASRKKVVNLMFFKTDKPQEKMIEIEGVVDGEKARIEMDLETVDFMNGGLVVTPYRKGKPVTDVLGRELCYSVPKYVEYAQKKVEVEEYENLYEQFVQNYLTAFGLSDMDSICDESKANFPYRFHRKGSVGFYASQIRMQPIEEEKGREVESGVRYCFQPVYGEQNEFQYKMDKLRQILRQHENSRVIVFFDYEVGDEDNLTMPVYDTLKNSSEFGGRVIDIDQISSDTKLEQLFNEKRNAVLVVTDRHLTEGANLQTCSIIVNFQITPNPLDMQQRIGRVFRLGQDSDIIIYSLADMYKLEGYVLTYFTRIGLMSSDTGDAEILAGCNNDNMVTIRCPKQGCGNIKLISREDLEGSGEIECEMCAEKNERTVMEEIAARDIKCDSKACGKVFTRSSKREDSSYMCITKKGIMCNDGVKGKRVYYCPKICALAHCERFTKSDGDMYGKCKALEIYRRLKNPTSPDIKAACASCSYRDICKRRGCIIGEGPEAISACAKCKYGSCKPKPQSIEFDGKWEATCPACGKGRLKPVKSNTFESYIRSLYEYKMDGGVKFCENFQKEIGKVIDIQDILRSDNLRTDD